MKIKERNEKKKEMKKAKKILLLASTILTVPSKSAVREWQVVTVA